MQPIDAQRSRWRSAYVVEARIARAGKAAIAKVKDLLK